MHSPRRQALEIVQGARDHARWCERRRRRQVVIAIQRYGRLLRGRKVVGVPAIAEILQLL